MALLHLWRKNADSLQGGPVIVVSPGLVMENGDAGQKVRWSGKQTESIHDERRRRDSCITHPYINLEILAYKERYP